jgi:small conductance mechanosensitive channel
MDLSKVGPIVLATVTDVGLKVIGALAIWIIGRWIIRFTINLMGKGMTRQHLDATLVRYAKSTIGALLNIILVVAILGIFGIQTTSFAAVLAAASFAIGAAWSGLLANFAAGAFLLVLRPFKAGDFVAAGGLTGTVDEIGLFTTTFNTPDNVRTFVGNNKIFADNIQNFSSNPYRRVELLAQIGHSTDHRQAIALLKDRVAKVPNVLNDPAPDVEILTFNGMGPVLAVRPYTNNDHYWQVYFDTNRVIQEAFGEAGFGVPEQHFALRTMASAAGAGF